MSQSTQEWKELTSKKEEFLHILRVLNHYYERIGTKVTDLFLFRQRLVQSDPSLVKIYLSKIGAYEYFVKASLETENSEPQTWLHIDGIAEERNRMKEIGNKEHPVFHITCLSDLFEQNTA
ncbi:LIC_13246 family protein [Leptospira idonii]|uniref:Uncharacterized protein n=1 Tax=Leptospira idonii TaxID=1193500 RepID=A0A4R9M114_9LEPT|nr:hypothetical protein [Leptospira idonii]TGN18929.1 hypothetical protein EHS15_10950 [Leptospira idonii]